MEKAKKEGFDGKVRLMIEYWNQGLCEEKILKKLSNKMHEKSNLCNFRQETLC
jgi:hypothetical protein